jgi:hypothetical protein
MTTGLAMERAPAADVFAHGSERDLVLVVLGLYQTLPHYVPKTTIEFSGALHEEVTKTIELTNPARKPIQYLVRVEGASVFELPLGKVVKLEPRQVQTMPAKQGRFNTPGITFGCPQPKGVPHKRGKEFEYQSDPYNTARKLEMEMRARSKQLRQPQPFKPMSRSADYFDETKSGIASRVYEAVPMPARKEPPLPSPKPAAIAADPLKKPGTVQLGAFSSSEKADAAWAAWVASGAIPLPGLAAKLAAE